MKEEDFIMKTCEKCGKEFADEILECPDCTAKGQVYEQALKNAKIMNIVALLLMAVGVICALFVNAWLGAILCLGTEIVCLIPNTKIQKLFKQNNAQTTDKKKFKADNKALTKELKSKNKDYKFSFIIALVALALLIAFVICDSVLSGWANSLPSDLQKDSYGSGIVNQIDTIGDLYDYSGTDFYNGSDNSKNSSDNGFVGAWEYSHTVNSDTMQQITPEEPCLTKMQIDEYNTGIFIYSTSNGEFECKAYWLLNEYTDKQMSVTLTGKIAQYGIYSYDSVIYLEEHDCISIIDGDLMHYYFRCS